MRLFPRLSLLAGLALTLVTGPLAQAAALTVTVADNSYSPVVLTATTADVITFTYNGNRSHPTESDNGSWTTFPMDAGHQSHTLPTLAAGTYEYHCQFHGAAGMIGMSGRIVVTAAPTGLSADVPYQAVLTAYPNPLSASRDGRLTLTFNQRANADGKVRLLNVIGRTVREAPLRRTDATAENRVTFDVADLPAGLYFYSLQQGDRIVETKRLMMQP